MYNAFYGFKEAPFSIAPNPRYLFMGVQHQEALAHLLYSLETRGGFVLLTGEVGTGKTTVTRCFLEKIPEDTEVAYILHPKMSAQELLASICDELDIRYVQTKFTTKNYIDVIQRRLLETYAHGKRTFLVIDEAQNLSDDVLEQVRLLTNLETAETKLLQIILIGQPELKDVFERESLRQLNQRITARFHLSHLAPEEVPAYVKHRLRIAGARRNPFTKKAVTQIYRLTGGIPRLVNVLCDRALLGGYVNELDRITADVVMHAAGEVFGSKKPKKKKKFSKLFSFVSRLKKSHQTLGLVAMILIVYTLVWEWVGESPLATLRYVLNPIDEVRVSPELEAELKERYKGLESLEGQEAVIAPNNQAETSDAVLLTQAMPSHPLADLTQPKIPSLVSVKVPFNPAWLNTDAHPQEPATINSLSALETSRQGFIRLLSYWGSSLDTITGIDRVVSLETLCSLIIPFNLSCLKKVGDLSSIQAFNRPALLQIGAPNSPSNAYVLLVGIDESHVILDSAAGEMRWDISFLEQRWSGEYHLVWREPPLYQGLIKPGSEKQAVLWLHQRLALLEDKKLFSAELPQNKEVFDEVLMRAVKAFQQSYGLTVDGLAGEQTIMQMNTLLDPDAPTLLTGIVDAGAS